MDILKTLEDRKNKLTALDKERTKVETLYEQAMGQLSSMGLDSLEAAKVELEKRKQQRAEAEAEAERLVKEFDAKYKDFI